MPRILHEDASRQSAELAEWIEVEAEDEPEIAEHDWRVELDDEVRLLIDPDRDDVADLLKEEAGVRSVVQLGREPRRALGSLLPPPQAATTPTETVPAPMGGHAR